MKRRRYFAALSARLPPRALPAWDRIPGGVPFLLSGRSDRSPRVLPDIVSSRPETGQPHPAPASALCVGGARGHGDPRVRTPVARTGVVPAALFFGIALKFPASFSVPAILYADAWLAAMPGPFVKESSTTSPRWRLVAGAAGIAVREGYRKGGHEANGVQEAIARSRALVLPWEESGNDGFPATGEMTEESSLLRREEELKDGIRQALERLLGLTGASHVAYIARSGSPGSVLYEGFLLSCGSPAAREISLPDTYVPVREATVFRKPFLEVGAGCEAVRSLEKRPRERPRRCRGRPRLQGGGGGRRPPCGTGR